MHKIETRPLRRYAFRMPVELERGRRAKASGLLIELSHDCARISQLSRGKYEEGDKVVILATPERQLSGTIRWTNNSIAGIRLDEPLPTPELQDLVAMNRRQQEQPELRCGT
ncbi:hypothetical protein OZN62_00730 [Aurantiacibacter sp. MUD11]|uniref:hypothetical protein n=1 Tax=Aurantiacibacter sp. MUD11 TaxID=3003265 RepID=UPI0022AA2ED0|nr:hypothetical protein [Aurantiacibacter sp. MUD11]WAT18135.1 hypothetical protein OZN62_00730 [Aurantiacibacter sp. MUD11]